MKFTLSVFVTLAVAVGIALAADAGPSNVKNAFDSAGIPKELNLTDFNPKAVLDMSFTGAPQQGSQSPPPPIPLDHAGAQLPEKNISNPPESFCLQVPGKPVNIGEGPFVIAMVTLDATTEKSDNSPARELSFVGGGFTFKDGGNCLANNTPAVTDYKPPSRSEPYQLVTFVFSQGKGFTEQTEITPATDRNNFSVSMFADSTGLGSPIAGTFVLVKPSN